MPEVEKWSRAHDTGGWQHSFQTSSMAEIFNGLLKGVRGLPVIAIATYSFYKCVEWFVACHTDATRLMVQGQCWAPTQEDFLAKAKLKANEQEYRCFDHITLVS